jgi:hypothetical protein
LERLGHFLPRRQNVVADFVDFVQVVASSVAVAEAVSLALEACQPSPDVAPALAVLAEEAAMIDVFTGIIHGYSLCKVSSRCAAKPGPTPHLAVEPEPAGADRDRPVVIRLTQAALQISYILLLGNDEGRAPAGRDEAAAR